MVQPRPGSQDLGYGCPGGIALSDTHGPEVSFCPESTQAFPRSHVRERVCSCNMQANFLSVHQRGCGQLTLACSLHCLSEPKRMRGAAACSPSPILNIHLTSLCSGDGPQSAATWCLFPTSPASQEARVFLPGSPVSFLECR